MKNFLLLTALIASMGLTACGKKSHDAAAEAAQAASATADAAATAASAAAAADSKPRLATYDPNLKPAQIVWDSAEKKKAWEDRQAQLRQAPKAAAATATTAAPVAPAATK